MKFKKSVITICGTNNQIVIYFISLLKEGRQPRNINKTNHTR